MVVIGGSAGSLSVVTGILSALPMPLAAKIIVVLHRKNTSDIILLALLSKKTALPVIEVEDKEELQPGHIYLTPPDYHLLIETCNSFSLDSSDRVHYSRPSIDVTFISVAEMFRNKVIGILLSGSNGDGAKGLAYIKRNGGTTLVQNPETAEFPFMPQQAINLNCVDMIINGNEIGNKLVEILGKLSISPES